jgi:hypothetical protein
LFGCTLFLKEYLFPYKDLEEKKKNHKTVYRWIATPVDGHDHPIKKELFGIGQDSSRYLGIHLFMVAKLK